MRSLGWLAAGSLLLHGWLPILLQVSLLTSEPDGHGHPHHTGTAAPATTPGGKGAECPLFHSAICLCSTFAKLLLAPRAPEVVRAFVRGVRRQRWRRSKPPRQTRHLLFEARAPPASA
jgi:hypothetical protein